MGEDNQGRGTVMDNFSPIFSTDLSCQDEGAYATLVKLQESSKGVGEDQSLSRQKRCGEGGIVAFCNSLLSFQMVILYLAVQSILQYSNCLAITILLTLIDYTYNNNHIININRIYSQRYFWYFWYIDKLLIYSLMEIHDSHVDRILIETNFFRTCRLH